MCNAELPQDLLINYERCMHLFHKVDRDWSHFCICFLDVNSKSVGCEWLGLAVLFLSCGPSHGKGGFFKSTWVKTSKRMTRRGKVGIVKLLQRVDEGGGKEERITFGNQTLEYKIQCTHQSL